MELENPSNGEPEDNGATHDPSNHFDEYFDSACSTPFVSAPSSPGRGGVVPVAGAFFFSAPSSPMHYVLTSSAFSSPASSAEPSSFEFEFSARFPASAAAAAAGSMSSADELFLNGQIRPMKLSSHLQRPQNLSPLVDLDAEEEDYDGGRGNGVAAEMGGVRGRDLKLRSRSIHRRARSHSPLRNVPFIWRFDGGDRKEGTDKNDDAGDPEELKQLETETPPVSASSSRSSSTSSSSSSSSSSSFNRKRWIFLKDLLHRSKSEGSGKPKEKFWHHLSFAVPKERAKHPMTSSPPIPPSPIADPGKEKMPADSPSKRMDMNTRATPAGQRSGSGAAPRRRRPAPSPHERHYTANRAQTEEMRRKTFLPYRQGLLGCLGFSSRSYGAINGFARSFHSVSSR